MDLLSRAEAARQIGCSPERLIYLEQTGRVKPITRNLGPLTMKGYTARMVKALKPLINNRDNHLYPAGMHITDAKFLDQDKKE